MARLDGIHIQRVQKQHSSAVVVIPKLVSKALDIKPGDYVIFTSHSGNNVVEISKFSKEVNQRGKNKVNPDRKVKGRRS